MNDTMKLHIKITAFAGHFLVYLVVQRKQKYAEDLDTTMPSDILMASKTVNKLKDSISFTSYTDSVAVIFG
jgi:hypothetical protein